ncbi:zinc finger protein AEBP2 [Salarias fasciatus]|uniref:Zinc finger protein AEBP2-like n=1 Tax=Salarias fasciatus TaxID=181472 RepID=A0A672II83_SALFA|nr:zinc finger protein AEBP2-like [Salarias fasciatus]
MAQITAEGAEHDSQPAADRNAAGEAAETGVERQQAEPDPKQEPGDNKESGGGGAGDRGPDKGSAAPGDEAAGDGEEPGKSPVQGSLASGSDAAPEGSRVLRAEQREREKESGTPAAPRCPPAEPGAKRRASLDLPSADGEPLSRMDSEDSIGSTLPDVDSTASSGRSTPAGVGGAAAGAPGGPAAAGGAKPLSYTCCWDHCLLLFPSSPDLAEHIRTTHVDGQRGGVFVCLWKGCKVYNTPSTSQSWLQRHMLTHSGDKPFKCVVGGCNATFASQGGLARHVPTHFSSQGSKLANQGRVKEESPSKAGLSKRRKMKNKHRRSLPRPHDFFDAQTMDAIRHRAICLNLATHIESLGNGHSVVFHSTVIARRKEDSGKVKVLLHWTPEDILPDVWVNESDRLQQKTKVVHLSKLPTDTAVLLDPNIYRMFF